MPVRPLTNVLYYRHEVALGLLFPNGIQLRKKVAIMMGVRTWFVLVSLVTGIVYN